MQPLMLEQIKLGLIRCAERWPERVGPRGWTRGKDDYCIAGQVLVDAGLFMYDERGKGLVRSYPSQSLYEQTMEAIDLVGAAMILNDSGMPWRQIVLRLGLVPGEQPLAQSESVVAKQNVVESADAVDCSTDPCGTVSAGSELAETASLILR